MKLLRIRMLAAAAVLLLGSRPASAQEVLFTIDGEEEQLLRGGVGAGDVDLDGTPDLLVEVVLNPGSIRLVSGADQSVLHEILDDSAQSSTGLGGSMDGAGDFDGDGVPDFVAGAPLDDTGGSGQSYDSGAVYVYSGADGSELVVVYGTSEDQRHGTWVAGLGDVDGDGYADVGASGVFEHRVWIYGGPDGHVIRIHPGVLTRPSIAGVGDMDFDGRPDYAIGWPQDSTNGQWTGRVTVFSGRTGEEIHTVHGEIPQGGGPTGDHLGVSVAGAGDVNADGIPDFVAGLPGEIDIGFGSHNGRVRVYSGADASILHEWWAQVETSGPTSKLGHRVAGGGDLNGDGYDDVLAAAPMHYDGLWYRGSVSAFSGKTGEMLWQIIGWDDAFRMYHHDLVGDIDGDGLADFAVGNSGAAPNGPVSGQVVVFAGTPGDATRFCDAAPNSTGLPARIETLGPISVGNDALRLYATGAVPFELGLFFYGPGVHEPPVPFGDGFLCTGGPFLRLAPPLTIGPDGTVERPLDFDQPPMDAGPGQVVPGAAFTFQFWYRDPAAGGSGFNLSDALRIEFPP